MTYAIDDAIGAELTDESGALQLRIGGDVIEASESIQVPGWGPDEAIVFVTVWAKAPTRTIAEVEAAWTWLNSCGEEGKAAAATFAGLRIPLKGKR